MYLVFTMRFRLREKISTNIKNKMMHNVLNYICDFVNERMSLRSGTDSAVCSSVSFYLYIQQPCVLLSLLVRKIRSTRCWFTSASTNLRGSDVSQSGNDNCYKKYSHLMRFILLNNCSILLNDDLWREFLPVTWHGFELRRTPFQMTMTYDLLRVTTQVAFNSPVFDTETRSDFISWITLTWSYHFIRWDYAFCYCSQYWILTVLGSIIISYDTYLQNLSLMCRSLNPTEIFRNWNSRKSIS